MLSCFVDKDYLVSFDKRSECLEYEFDLERRWMNRPNLSTELRSDAAARNFFDQYVDTPERLMAFAKEVNLPKLELAKLLKPDTRRFYLEVCASIEKAITEACTAKGDPCLEDGCALEGEICLNACLTAGQAYSKACVNVWIEMFRNPDNRIDAWRK